MDPIMVEKAAARRRYRRIRQLHTLFRCVEAFATLFLLSWSSARLPIVARLSVDLFSRLVAVLLGPRFIFLLGNAIVIILFAMSGRHRPDSSGCGDVYDQFLACRSLVTQSRPALRPPPPDSVEKEEKEVPVCGDKVRRACRRSRSERMERRRSKPDLCRSKSDVSGEEEDAEEFRRTIEEFIEKQLRRFHREESMAGVVSSYAGTPEPQAAAVATVAGV